MLSQRTESHFFMCTYILIYLSSDGHRWIIYLYYCVHFYNRHSVRPLNKLVSSLLVIYLIALELGHRTILFLRISYTIFYNGYTSAEEFFFTSSTILATFNLLVKYPNLLESIELMKTYSIL